MALCSVPLPISDEGRSAETLHMHGSVRIIISLTRMKMILSHTETRGLWLRVLIQYLFHSIAKRSLSKDDLKISTSSE